jgi:hypothetical protein
MFPLEYFSPAPHPDLPIVDKYIPLPGQRLIGYMIYEKPNTCVVAPKPDRLSNLGWACVMVLGCIPCCISSFYEGFQIAVYE